jgi:hypothetical protein
MIPARSLNGEHAGIEVRYRVAACRKRLRDHRTPRQLPAPVQMNEQLSQIDTATAGDPARSFEQEEADR